MGTPFGSTHWSFYRLFCKGYGVHVTKSWRDSVFGVSADRVDAASRLVGDRHHRNYAVGGNGNSDRGRLAYLSADRWNNFCCQSDPTELVDHQHFARASFASS